MATSNLATQFVFGISLEREHKGDVRSQTLLRDERLLDAIDNKVSTIVETAFVYGRLGLRVAAFAADHHWKGTQKALTVYTTIDVATIVIYVVHNVDNHIRCIRDSSKSSHVWHEFSFRAVRLDHHWHVHTDIAHCDSMLFAGLFVYNSYLGRFLNNVRQEEQHEIVVCIGLVTHQPVSCKICVDHFPDHFVVYRVTLVSATFRRTFSGVMKDMFCIRA